jgi:hypothetical protein
MSIRLPKRLPRGVKKDDPRIYYLAETEEEADANVRKCKGDRGKLNHLLKRAAYHDDLLTARAALRAGANPNSQNLLGEGPMQSLCCKGSVEMLRLFLDHGASLGPDQFGTPPMIHAIEQFREDLVAEMIKRGADVNARENTVLASPLHRAVTRSRCVGIVRLLLEAGADPRAPNAGGEGALEVAQAHKKLFGDIPPVTFRLLRTALKHWADKPSPRKPRRRAKSDLLKLADRTVDNDPGGP